MKKSRDYLAHPLILRAAWLRMREWYGGSDLAPEGEFAEWKLHPEHAIRGLRRELLEGCWHPKVWPQIPFPKKGQILRHYTLPSVKDQVAFMAYMVLLGPIVDALTHKFCFGNRWYRPIAWNRRLTAPGWEHRPYPLLTGRTYVPYPRSHGIYRRVANWTVSSMTGTAIRSDGISGPVQTMNDYKFELPEFIKADWWGTEAGADSRAWWASLDLQMAYPSVRLSKLRETLVALMGEEHGPALGHHPKLRSTSLLSGYPSEVADALFHADLRVELAHDLMDRLEETRVDGSQVPQHAWRPAHVLSSLPPENSGIPTGLAISGALLNVALWPLDRHVSKYLNRAKGDNRCAFLRFADDMVLLSKSPLGLMRLIDEAWKGLCSDSGAKLSERNATANLHLNLQKVAPDPVGRILSKYLQAFGWKTCTECKELTTPDELAGAPVRAMALSAWWKSLSQEDAAIANLRDDLNRCGLDRDALGPFVTTLVERLSDVGRDSLRDRFGEGPRDRLLQLHELLRFEIDDQQVRPDTRRLFAANRLAMAWLPTHTDEEAAAALEEIRTSVGIAFKEAPWKPQVWRAIVRASVRRPMGRADVRDEQRAESWLISHLERVAHVSDLTVDRKHWFSVWPESDRNQPCGREPRNHEWRSLYLSFHRTAFWKAVADVIRQLAVCRERNSAKATVLKDVPPSSWTMRAVPEGRESHLFDWLSAADRWFSSLYPAGTPPLANWSWELDAIVHVALSGTGRRELSVALRRARLPAAVLSCPDQIEFLKRNPRVRSLLESSGRLGHVRRSYPLGQKALAHLLLAHEESGFQSLPKVDLALSSEAGHAPPAHTRVTSMAESLGVDSGLEQEALQRLLLRPKDLVEVLGTDQNVLFEYSVVRRFRVQFPLESGITLPTLHRVLWGVTPERDDIQEWRLRPWEIPAVGLSTCVGASLFCAAQSAAVPENWRIDHGPLNWHIQADTAQMMASGRLAQFAVGITPKDDERSVKTEVARITSWEVPPHPAYFLPFLHGEGLPAKSDYVLFCDVLLLLTALDGSEQILDSLTKNGIGAVPFEDRWWWRARIHLSEKAWKIVDQILQWAETPEQSLGDAASELEGALFAGEVTKLRMVDFTSERVDLSLDLKNDLEVCRSVKSSGQSSSALPDELLLDAERLVDSLVVRIGQVSITPDWKKVFRDFPQLDQGTRTRIMEQVAAAFLTPTHGSSTQDVAIVVLPEVTVPEIEIQTVRDLVARTGKATLAGLFWRVLPPVMPSNKVSVP